MCRKKCADNDLLLFVVYIENSCLCLKSECQHIQFNPQIRNIIEKSWCILEGNKTTWLLSSLGPPPVLLRKSPKACRYCPKINKTGTVKSHTTGKIFKCYQCVNCQSNIDIPSPAKLAAFNMLAKHLATSLPVSGATWIPSRTRRTNQSAGISTSAPPPPDKPLLEEGRIITVVGLIPFHPISRSAQSEREKQERRWMVRRARGNFSPYLQYFTGSLILMTSHFMWITSSCIYASRRTSVLCMIISYVLT